MSLPEMRKYNPDLTQRILDWFRVGGRMGLSVEKIIIGRDQIVNQELKRFSFTKGRK